MRSIFYVIVVLLVFHSFALTIICVRTKRKLTKTQNQINVLANWQAGALMVTGDDNISFIFEGKRSSSTLNRKESD